MTTEQRHERQFGFLSETIAGDFSGGRITPLEDYADRLKWFEGQSNRDGYYYPPEVATYTIDPRTHEKKEKGSAFGATRISLQFAPFAQTLT